MNLKYLLTSVVVCAAVSVNAAAPVDLGEMQPDVVYEYQSMVPVMGYYTPTESGVMRCYSTGEEISVYQDADHKNEIVSSNSFYSAVGEKVRVYSVTGGETVYFYNALPIAGGTFRFSVGKEAIELGTVDPSTDDILSISTAYRAEIAFNVAVKCSKCTIEINGESAELTPDVSDSYVTVNWFNTLRQWYRDGKINEGDVLTLTLTGIRDEYDSSNRPDFGDGVGKLVLKYTMAGRPAELVSATGTPDSGVSDFMSYYLPGSDQGIVSLVFSEDLDPECHPIAEIQYGDPDNIEAGMYIEYPPVAVNGNTLTVDLQGVTRFPDEMVPGLPAQSTIALIVSNIKSADGQYVLTGQVASPLSYGFSYNLKSVVYSIAADWLPLPGSALGSGDDMEIWVLNGQQIMFDSVDFSYVRDGSSAVASVPFSALKVTVDSEDALLYNLTAPVMDADPDTDITVSFGGLKCADGLDHSSDIFVKYKASTTGISEVTGDDSDAVYFDLTGRRVMTPTKGIYISNGKKIIVK